MADRMDLSTLELPITPFTEHEKLLWGQMLAELKDQLERLEECLDHQRVRLSQSAEYGQIKGMTWAEVGNSLGVSRERARQIAGK